MPQTLLIVDDEEIIRRSIRRLFDGDFNVVEAEDGEEALLQVRSSFPDLVLLDQRLPKKLGIEVLEEIKQFDPGISVIMITAYGEVALAVEAMRLGAAFFIEKPFDNEKLRITVQKTLRERALAEEVRVRRDMHKREGPKMIYGESEGVRNLRRIISKVAQSDVSPVLVLGESGVGKELVARALHFEGPRSDCPFLEVNCSAIPAQLLESELFGYEKGAFTDAKQRKHGLIEVSDTGSLFLDEIGDLDVSLQSKLLRFLEERKFRRVGGVQEISVNLKIIAATNVNLEEAIRDKLFRHDLFFRLNLMPIAVPPLRDRGTDVLILAEAFVEEFNREYRKSFQGLHDDVAELFLGYGWPGNVRELRNVIERIIIIEDSKRIEPQHVSCLTGLDKSAGFDIGRFESMEKLPRLEAVEMEYIESVLGRTRGNKTQAAKILGISREGLSKKLKRYAEAPRG